jgi:ribonuclease VapC
MGRTDNHGVHMAEPESVVLDASALLAFARSEPGAERVRGMLGTASMSAVSVAECLAVFSRFTTAAVAAQVLSRLGLNVIACDWQTSVLAAEIHASARGRGLALAECISLATARRLGVTALTANSDWHGLDVDVRIEVLC